MDIRVLVSAVPAIGHIIPLLDLAQSLQEAGHDLRFATNVERHGLISAAGLRPLEAGMDLAEMEGGAPSKMAGNRGSAGEQLGDADVGTDYGTEHTA